MILKDRTKKMKRENILKFTHRPYVDFDSYVETYKNFVNKKHVAIFSKLGSCSEALVYAMHKNLSEENPTIIGNGLFHYEGAEKGIINECMLSIPLNGIKILEKIVYSNILIDGTPSEYRFI